MGAMQNWFPSSDTQEDADLDGEPVTRVSGVLDISAALKDLQALAKRGAISGSEELKSISAADIREVEKATSDPKFTVDVGRDDGKLRRIVASMKFSDGTDSGTMSLSLRFKDVDKPVTIDAPTSGKPIEELGEVIGEEFGGGSDGDRELRGGPGVTGMSRCACPSERACASSSRNGRGRRGPGRGLGAAARRPRRARGVRPRRAG